MAAEWADKLRRCAASWAGRGARQGCGTRPLWSPLHGRASPERAPPGDDSVPTLRRPCLSAPRPAVPCSYTALTEVQVRPNPKNAKETAVAVSHEGERVLKALPPGARVVLLDERGRDASSEDMARLLAQVRRTRSLLAASAPLELRAGWAWRVHALAAGRGQALGPVSHPPAAARRPHACAGIRVGLALARLCNRRAVWALAGGARARRRLDPPLPNGAQPSGARAWPEAAARREWGPRLCMQPACARPHAAWPAAWLMRCFPRVLHALVARRWRTWSC